VVNSNDDEVKLARAAVLRTFRWVNGHASFVPVFLDAEALRMLGPGLVKPFRDAGTTAVVAPEARGFILGSLCAVTLGVGLLAARKPGFPRPEDQVNVVSDRDWRGRRVEFSVARVLTETDRVLLVDDWIETGSQATAIGDAIRQMGAMLVGTAVIVDQAPSAVRAALNVVGLLRHDELPASD
jgi:adenine phosphoribosyltransferase